MQIDPIPLSASSSSHWLPSGGFQFGAPRLSPLANSLALLAPNKLLRLHSGHSCGSADTIHVSFNTIGMNRHTLNEYRDINFHFKSRFMH